MPEKTKKEEAVLLDEQVTFYANNLGATPIKDTLIQGVSRLRPLTPTVVDVLNNYLTVKAMRVERQDDGKINAREITYYYPRKNSSFQMVERNVQERTGLVLHKDIEIRNHTSNGSTTILQTDLASGTVRNGKGVAYTEQTLLDFLTLNTQA